MLSKDSLYLIDSYSFIYRAYYAITDLSNSKGLLTNAIFGFTKMFLKIMQEEKPDYCAAVFDVKGPTFRQKVFEEYTEVLKKIAYLEELLANPRRVLLLIKDEVTELKSKYGDPRRTEISAQGEVEYNEEDLIPHQRVVVTLSNRGFVKRVPSQLYSPQHRGGKGITAFPTRENDAARLLVVADTHDSLLFFTNTGRVFHIKCYEIPAGSSRTAKGLAVINLFPIAEGERVTDIVPVTEFTPDTYLLLATVAVI